MIDIVKELRKPEQVWILEALTRRVPPGDARTVREVEGKLRRAQAGFAGEKQLFFYLQSLAGSAETHLLLHNVRLVDESAYQMDVVVLTTRYVLILEVKHIHGLVHFGDHDQFTREDTNVEIFSNPLEQCLRQERLLKTFLEFHNLPAHFPVFSRVVFTSNKTILSVSEVCKTTIRERVWRGDAVVSKMKELNFHHSHDQISVKEMYRLAHVMMQHHTPAWLSPLKSFGLTFEDLQKGMYCLHCFGYTLQKEKWHTYWICSECGNLEREPT
ncbi:hypothetical protein JCM19037_3293 [Geomicrobium sp. JCM 19037]|uniref:nuclease-related domain-containing protein n=1 Tax=Geomicrobium sp. JCM 19037 TaxID=1460634 RepID=UPI00045F365F|nr:nuclease-related domain-containing protein [Geomicrobium sp. JCM 19037]GAK04841.1 hypothetical protein JCM19037_3293 [Geomicrobium sp. JCM 19037]